MAIEPPSERDPSRAATPVNPRKLVRRIAGDRSWLSDNGILFPALVTGYAAEYGLSNKSSINIEEQKMSRTRLKIISRSLVMLLIVAGVSNTGAAPFLTTANAAAADAFTEKDKTEIRATLAAYNIALNGGRTDAVLPLYTANGICMAPFSPSHVGQAALREAYDGFFREMKFDVRFDILEVVVASGEWAFARTASSGTTLHHATGKTTNEANQELFVLRKSEDGRWRIARYSFSPTKPQG